MPLAARCGDASRTGRLCAGRWGCSHPATILRCGRAKRTLGTSFRHTSTAGGMTAEEDQPMPLYLTRFSYTPATWAKLIKNPEDRRAAAKEYIEAVGGKLHGFWYAFGDHDG